MTRTGPDRSRHQPAGFAEARAEADRAETTQRHRAARTVAGHSLDACDCRELLSMLGLANPAQDTVPAHARHHLHRH